MPACFSWLYLTIDSRKWSHSSNRTMTSLAAYWIISFVSGRRRQSLSVQDFPGMKFESNFWHKSVNPMRFLFPGVDLLCRSWISTMPTGKIPKSFWNCFMSFPIPNVNFSIPGSWSSGPSFNWMSLKHENGSIRNADLRVEIWTSAVIPEKKLGSQFAGMLCQVKGILYLPRNELDVWNSRSTQSSFSPPMTSSIASKLLLSM